MIELHSVEYEGMKPVQRKLGMKFCVNPKMVSLIVDGYSERNEWRDCAILYISNGHSQPAIKMTSFESVAEVMEKISAAEKRK